MKTWELPYTFPNGLTVKNRLAFAPISTMSSNGIGQLSDTEIAFYKSRAKEAGVIILGSANVSSSGKAYENNVGIAHDAVIPNLKTYNREVKAFGAKSIIQLYHGGRAISFQSNKSKVGVVSRKTKDGNNCYEWSEKDILSLIEEFGKAIRRAIRAGFDGIEIHAGNPFLLQEFLSPLSNQREDKWGDSEQSRFRFLEVILRLANQIRTEAAYPFVIGIRLAVEEADPNGLSFEETSRIVERLSNLNIDYVHFNQNDFREKGKQIEELQKLNDSLPIINNGGIMNGVLLEEALRLTPLASVARPLILTATFPHEVKTYETIDDLSQKELLAPNGLWKSMNDSLDWYLNR